jgi:predicted transcriptional regulator
LTKLQRIFEEEGTDWWDDLDEQEKKQIATGLSQADKGLLTSQKKVMKRFDKWR